MLDLRLGQRARAGGTRGYDSRVLGVALCVVMVLLLRSRDSECRP
jgi:hypothetical protein